MKNFLALFFFILASCRSVSQSSQDVNAIIADYQVRINQNAGSISGSDLSAVTNFVGAAKTHQYWDKLVDVGPLAGNDMNAAAVKLKRPAKGAAVIENNGFLSADYLPDLGFRLSPLKSFNTKTNLSALNLQGLFGYSMWIEKDGGAWMGAPNNDAPFSMLMAGANSVIAYSGLPSSFATVGGRVGPSTDAFYHFVKRSLDSAKVFVDGAQVGETSTTLTSPVLRNADVEVFKEASAGGVGSFYCIDDGTLTDEEVRLFYADVRQLLYDLGRKLAPPVISSNGLYTQAQNVSVTPAFTSSSLAGAVVHYTIDGTDPTFASPVCGSPLAVSNSVQIRAVSIKNGRVSKPANAWIAIVPEGFTSSKYYTAHVMVNLLSFTNNMDEWLNQMKASGYNLIWAHLDDYTGSYVTTLKNLLDAAQRVGGIPVMTGASWWVSPSLVSQMFHDTWDHPAIFRIGGKRVYTSWDYQPDNQRTVDSLLSIQNISKSQYYLWVHSRYPYSWDGGKTWVGEYLSSDGYVKWETGVAGIVEDIDHLYNTRPQLDGLINFAVDLGGKQKVINTNRLITKSSLQRGKFSMAGVSALYASVSFSDFGFKGAAEIWDSVLASPAGCRPTAMSDITANDYAELSYISPMVIPPVNGLCYVPPLNAGFHLGENIRYPLTDHSGVQKFLRPWVDAFLNNQVSPSFSEDRMFAWYWLHPKDQQPNPVLPDLFNGYPQSNQEWWNSTVYATGNISVGGTNQVYGMKTYIPDGMNKIRMAAHLTAPAQLKINDSLSEVKPAGAAYFEIPMESFRGVPTFGIVRDGVEIKKGPGVQPITDNAFPGGWNFLSTEILANTTLPVTFTSIKANQKTAGIQVEWTVQQQRDISRYEVEKSTDGRQFTKAGSVQAVNAPAGNYNWFDAYPSEGNNHYRIKIIEGTGIAKYSTVVNVNVGRSQSRFDVFPNPVVNNTVQIQLVNTPKGSYNLELINAAGQAVFMQKMEHSGGSASQTIVVPANVPSGNYHLKITGSGMAASKQLFK